MSAVPTAGALLAVALTHVLAGILPITFSGDAHLALWLVSLLVGILTYVSLEREMAGVRA
ncbi:hypothetical protein [Halobellus ordinarius]|uniref:hypothetical protein n=1 Tax=Halobellus ordinarius TaxID=3075120 RepID=UPI002880B5B3|nr:hypothetical protein [Halobellus sp. ZY16]